jgi:general secretion pathway protein A
MILEHYGLREPPFSITPDPRFVYLSERHRDALAHLLYGIGQGGSGGFVQLTGEVGTGKTTLSRLLLEQLPDNVRVALILNPLLSPVELLEAIGEELRIDLTGRRGNLKGLVDALNACLLDAYAAGQRVVLVIDEAQNLSTAALEQVRLLTNLETPTQKLLQIILLGQPELRDKLARPELRQLAQRITARYHLDPLEEPESEAYLRHRYAVAGGTRFPFTAPALRRLHRQAGGVPRLLNVIAERGLLAGYARGTQQIDGDLLDLAAAEVLAPASRPAPLPLRIAGLVALALLALVLAWRWPHATVRAAPSVRATPTIRPVPTQASAAKALPLLDAEAFAQLLLAHGQDGTGAWAELLALWAVRADETALPTASACPARLAPTLFCVTARASVDRLAQFDRPLLLRLRAHDRTRVDALLVGLGPRRARLQLGDALIEVDRGTLDSAYTGRYSALVRAPQPLDVPLRRGDRGTGVDWLRRRLLPVIPAPASSAIAGQEAAATAYDDALVAAVQRLQSQFGLRADGVLRVDTLLALLAADVPGPHLKRLPE